MQSWDRRVLSIDARVDGVGSSPLAREAIGMSPIDALIAHIGITYDGSAMEPVPDI